MGGTGGTGRLGVSMGRPWDVHGMSQLGTGVSPRVSTPIVVPPTLRAPKEPSRAPYWEHWEVPRAALVALGDPRCPWDVPAGG